MERAADLKQHISMVHEFTRLEKEADVREKEADAKKITVDKKKHEAETARLESNCGVAATTWSSGEQRGQRRAPLQRPTIQEDCTESDWSFSLACWGRYALACKLHGGEVVSHLWSACL